MKVGKRIATLILTGIMTVMLLAGIPLGENGKVDAARRTLKGPSKNNDGVVTWDCIYFGNYPQSDQTGKTKEPIKWRVLSVNGNDVFLVADQNLDVQQYNATNVNVTWENSTMRSWLNGYGSTSNLYGKDYSNNNFIDRAFTEYEQASIKITTVTNTTTGTQGSASTKDKIFLLSYDEVTNPVYGFSSAYDAEDDARKRKNTAYVAEGGTIGSNSMYNAGKSDMWWLRSQGNTSNNASRINSKGVISSNGIRVDYNGNAVCPALHLNLSTTEFWTYAGTVSSDGTSTKCPHANTETKGIKEASCTETGSTGYTACSDCGIKLKDDSETIPLKEHQWNDGVIIKEATKNADEVKTYTCTVCGETKTKSIEGTSEIYNVSKEVQAVTDESIAKQNSEDVKGAVFNSLRARTTKFTNKSITLKWNKVSKADGYKIYGNRCGKKNHYKLITDIGKSKTSYTHKKLKKGTYYKYVIAAYKVIDGKKVTIAVSKTIHATTTGGKYGVAKSVTVNKSKVTLKAGKKITIKAKEIKKNKTIKRHRKIAFESSNTKIATVNKSGVVKAKRKGNCYIYVYAQNGVYKRVKVTVK